MLFKACLKFSNFVPFFLKVICECETADFDISISLVLVRAGMSPYSGWNSSPFLSDLYFHPRIRRRYVRHKKRAHPTRFSRCCIDLRNAIEVVKLQAFVPLLRYATQDIAPTLLKILTNHTVSIRDLYFPGRFEASCFKHLYFEYVSFAIITCVLVTPRRTVCAISPSFYAQDCR
jgi:hypothetical protein